MQFDRKWGGFGKFDQPAGIAIAGNNVYVVERKVNRCVFLQSPDNGHTLNTYFQNVGMFDPMALALSPMGHLFVADTKNHRILRLDPATQLLLAWGRQGHGNGELSYPWGLAVDSAGRLYVVRSAAAMSSAAACSMVSIASGGSAHPA